MIAILIIVLVLLIGAVLVTTWLGFNLLAQHGEIVIRLEAIEGTQLASGAGQPPMKQNAGYAAVPEIGEAENIMVEGLLPGTRAPSFRIPDINGSEVSLERFEKTPLLLVFSDPYCEPCDRLLPRLQEVAARQSAVQVLIISRGDALINRRKVEEFGLTFPVALQRQWEVSRVYGMVAAPIAFLIDENGIIAETVAVGEEGVLNLFDSAAASPLDRG